MSESVRQPGNTQFPSTGTALPRKGAEVIWAGEAHSPTTNDMTAARKRAVFRSYTPLPGQGGKQLPRYGFEPNPAGIRWIVWQQLRERGSPGLVRARDISAVKEKRREGHVVYRRETAPLQIVKC